MPTTPKAGDDYVSGSLHVPCGYARYATTTSVQNLDADPTDGKKISECSRKPIRALIQAETQAVRWTDDLDVDPSTSVGMLIPANTTLEYDGDLNFFRFINGTAGAIVHVSYYF